MRIDSEWMVWMKVLSLRMTELPFFACTQIPYSLYWLNLKRKHIRSKIGYFSASSGIVFLIMCIILQNYLVVQGNFLHRHMNSSYHECCCVCFKDLVGWEVQLWIVMRTMLYLVPDPYAKCILLGREECVETTAFIQQNAAAKCLYQSFSTPLILGQFKSMTRAPS